VLAPALPAVEGGTETPEVEVEVAVDGTLGALIVGRWPESAGAGASLASVGTSIDAVLPQSL